MCLRYYVVRSTGYVLKFSGWLACGTLSREHSSMYCRLARYKIIHSMRYYVVRSTGYVMQWYCLFIVQSSRVGTTVSSGMYYVVQ